MSGEREKMEDPSALLLEMGPARPSDGEASGAPLDALRAHIEADLDARQGPWRQKSLFARCWPAGIIVLAGAWLMFVWPGALLQGSLALQLASLAGAFAATLCLLAALLAPTQPGKAERISLGGLLFAGAALLAQAVLGMQSAPEVFSMPNAIKCGSSILLFAAAPAALIAAQLWRSGLPLRPLHAGATLGTALAIGGVAVWRHCPIQESWHIWLSHAAWPLLSGALLALGLERLLRRSPPTPPAFDLSSRSEMG